MKVKAFRAYTARKASELTLAVDDIIVVDEKFGIDQWKGRREKSGETGFFPTNCVVPLEGERTPPPPSIAPTTTTEKAENNKRMPFKPLKQIGSKKEATLVAARVTTTPLETAVATATASGNGASAASIESAPKLPPKPVREQVRVIYGYKAQNEDELTIKEGEIITVIAKDNEDAGWWKGELNGRIALFPDNFVEPIQPSPPPPLPRPTDNDKLRIRKPDRGGGGNIATPPSTTATPNSSTAPTPAASATSAGTEPSPSSATTTSTANNNTFSSVPIIGKMLKFGQSSNSSSTNNASPQKSASDLSNSHSNGPSKVSVANTSDSSPADEDKSSSEDPFNAEPVSPSKLVHLTAQRPKIPSNSRRPPSMHFGKNAESLDLMEDMDMEEPLTNGRTESPKKPTIMENPKMISANIALKPVPKPESESPSSPEKKAPWLTELKKSQERRRTNELLGNEQNRKSISGPPAPTPSAKPHAPPTPAGAKPFVSNSKPSLLTTQHSSPSSMDSHSAQHQQTGNSAQPTEAISPVAPKPSFFTSPVHTASGQSNLSESSPVLSVNNSSHSTTTTVLVNGGDSVLEGKVANQARDEELTKMRNEVSDLKSTVFELRASVGELRRELALQSASTQSAAEWTTQKAELEKQIQEQHVFFETHKKNLTEMVKELINELAEEKKKIAGVQIELDRMRKLTTTV